MSDVLRSVPKNNWLRIGKKLYNKVKSVNDNSFFTVNSSPYAHEVYKHLEFVDTNQEQCINGLRFYPMRIEF